VASDGAGESDADCCEGSEQITFLSVLDILTARSRQGNQAWEGGEAAGGGDLEVSLAASWVR
jgi:hypothetical protein